jgi:hypothetical protein
LYKLFDKIEQVMSTYIFVSFIVWWLTYIWINQAIEKKSDDLIMEIEKCMIEVSCE